jgi:hypothetical protein
MSPIRYNKQEIESNGILPIFTSLCKQHNLHYMQMLKNQPNKQISVLRRATCGKNQKTGITHVREESLYSVHMGAVCTKVRLLEFFSCPDGAFLPSSLGWPYLTLLDTNNLVHCPGRIVGHNPSKSVCFRARPLTCCDVSVALY